jgi:mRNA interferase MazF
MNRGEVWWTDFEGSGGEMQKRRPAVIVSRNRANRLLNRVQVVPLTSQVRRVYPGETIVKLNGGLRKAMATQITTAAKERIRDKVGSLSDTDLKRVEAALRIQLAL